MTVYGSGLSLAAIEGCSGYRPDSHRCCRHRERTGTHLSRRPKRRDGIPVNVGERGWKLAAERCGYDEALAMLHMLLHTSYMQYAAMSCSERWQKYHQGQNNVIHT